MKDTKDLTKDMFPLSERIRYELDNDVQSDPFHPVIPDPACPENQVLIETVGMRIPELNIIAVPGTLMVECEEQDVATVIYPADAKDFRTGWLAWYRTDEVTTVALYSGLTSETAGRLMCGLMNTTDPGTGVIPTISPDLWP